MKEVIIHVSDGFEVPSVINTMSLDEWQVWLTCIGEIHDAQGLINNDMLQREADVLVKTKYSRIIDDQNKKLEEYSNTVSLLNDKLETLKCTMREEHNSEIVKLTHESSEYKSKYNKQLEELDTLRRNQINELEQRNRKQVEELEVIRRNQINELEQSNRNQMNELEQSNRKQLEELEQRTRKQFDEIELEKINLRRSLFSKFETEVNELNQQILLHVNQKNELKDQLTKQYEDQITKHVEAYKSLKYSSQEELYNTKSQLKEQLTKQYEDQITKHVEAYQSLKYSSQEELHNTKLQIKEQLISQFEEKDRQSKQQTKQYYEKKLSQELLVLQREIENQQTHINNLNESITEYKLQKSSIDEINNTLKPLAKFYSKSTEEKGTAGEKFIYNILTLSEKYSGAIVEDTSGLAKHGDLLFKWKQMKCMIEVKNKVTLRREDIEKFERDIDASVISSNINCALFISLQTDIFPSRSRNIVQFDYYNNILVSYLYLSSISDIHYVICCMDKLILSVTTNDEQTTKLIKHFTNYYALVTSTKTFYEKQIVSKNKEIGQLTKLIKQLDNENKLITFDYTTFVKSDNIETEEDIEETVTENITEDTNETQQVTETSSVKKHNISTDNVKKYILQLLHGHKLSIRSYKIDKEFIANKFKITVRELDASINFDKLISECKKDFLSQSITQEQAITLINLKTIDKKNKVKYPPKVQAISAGVFTELISRKLGLISDARDAYQCICKYCEEITEEISEEVEE